MKALHTGIITCLLAFSPISHADTLLLDVLGETPANTEAGLLRPTKGMTDKQVLRKFGEPLTKAGEIGYPPIISWKYDKFTVYFEFELVITTVVHRE
ncbi:MAG: hypothetical protein HOM11_03110 [Methylococcales bacterium]|nr:hypothetical protein [Methylococcales bacterium]MBT7443976.1 hypothetical protein [Methylococcales bacterium]